MATRRYEVLVLVTPEITRDEERSLEKELAELVSNAEGDVVSYDRWGKFLLAYPVKKHEYGIYILMRFNVAAEKTSELLQNVEHAFNVRYNAIVMRHMFDRLEADTSHSYKRPDSLEEGSAKDVNTFLKENKMSGASGSAEDSKKEGRSAQSAEDTAKREEKAEKSDSAQAKTEDVATQSSTQEA
jgi:small subunit ribosomal protein S6